MKKIFRLNFIVQVIALSCIIAFYSSTYASNSNLNPESFLLEFSDLFYSSSDKEYDLIRSKSMDFSEYRRQQNIEFYAEYFTDRWNCKRERKYELKSMVSMIDGYDTREYDRNMDVRYLNEFDRELYLLRIANGKLCDIFGNLINTGDGETIFVMDKKGNIYIHTKDKVNYHLENIYHSSFLAGGKVASAGEMYVKNGDLIFLENSTGHYKIGFHKFIQVIDELVKRSYRFRYVEVQCYEDENVKFVINSQNSSFNIKELTWNDFEIDKSV